MLIMISLIILV